MGTGTVTGEVAAWLSLCWDRQEHIWFSSVRPRCIFVVGFLICRDGLMTAPLRHCVYTYIYIHISIYDYGHHVWSFRKDFEISWHQEGWSLSTTREEFLGWKTQTIESQSAGLLFIWMPVLKHTELKLHVDFNSRTKQPRTNLVERRNLSLWRSKPWKTQLLVCVVSWRGCPLPGSNRQLRKAPQNSLAFKFVLFGSCEDRKWGLMGHVTLVATSAWPKASWVAVAVASFVDDQICRRVRNLLQSLYNPPGERTPSTPLETPASFQLLSIYLSIHMCVWRW